MSDAALKGWRAVIRPANAVAAVRTLVKLQPVSGADTLAWDGRGADGAVVPNGTYHVSIQALDTASNRSAPCDTTVTVQSALDAASLAAIP